jgi:hypothetical protein
MNHGLEEGGIRIPRNLRAQPTEMRPKTLSSGILPMLGNLRVTLLAQRTPNSPSEYPIRPSDWNLQTSTDIEAVAFVALNLALLITER